MIQGIENRVDSFFTPIHFDSDFEGSKSLKQQAIEAVENYFQLFDTKAAFVLPNQSSNEKQYVEIRETKKNETIADYLLVAAKIISYVTVIVPLILFAVKAIIRCTNQFEVKKNIPEAHACSLNPKLYDITSFWSKIDEAGLGEKFQEVLDTYFSKYKGEGRHPDLEKNIISDSGDADFFPNLDKLLKKLEETFSESEMITMLQVIEDCKLAIEE